jgi:CDP-diacylglycerol--serine O-phosphatidyltransferase
VHHFEGTPITTSVLLVGLLALATRLGAIQQNLWFGRVKLGRFALHALVLVYGLSGP